MFLVVCSDTEEEDVFLHNFPNTSNTEKEEEEDCVCVCLDDYLCQLSSSRGIWKCEAHDPGTRRSPHSVGRSKHKYTSHKSINCDFLQKHSVFYHQTRLLKTEDEATVKTNTVTLPFCFFHSHEFCTVLTQTSPNTTLLWKLKLCWNTCTADCWHPTNTQTNPHILLNCVNTLCHEVRRPSGAGVGMDMSHLANRRAL